MQLVVLSIHLIVCLCLVGLVLLQRSEGGALGMGGGGGSLVSGRGAADALAKMTSVAGGFFLVTSLSLTFLSGAAANASSRSVFDIIPRQERTAPVVPAPVAPPPATTPDPTESSAPQAAETQVASLTQPAAPQTTAAPVTATPVAPPATSAVTRAAPLEARPQQTSARAPATATPTATTRQTTPTTQPARQPTTTTAAVSQPVRQTTTAATPPQPARSATTTTTRPLILPNTSGGSAGLTTTAPTDAESVEVVNGVEAVRRERAGPDQ